MGVIDNGWSSDNSETILEIISQKFYTMAYEQTDRQTDRQTLTLVLWNSAILSTPLDTSSHTSIKHGQQYNPGTLRWCNEKLYQYNNDS